MKIRITNEFDHVCVTIDENRYKLNMEFKSIFILTIFHCENIKSLKGNKGSQNFDNTINNICYNDDLFKKSKEQTFEIKYQNNCIEYSEILNSTWIDATNETFFNILNSIGNQKNINNIEIETDGIRSEYFKLISRMFQ